jgi:hypothetical protein
MNKLIKALVVFVVLTNILNAKSLDFTTKGFKQVVKNTPTNNITKTISKISGSKNMSGFIKTIDFKKYTPVDNITKVAQNIANKSPFADKLMASQKPLYVMELYAKHGDSFLKTSKVATTKVININQKLLSSASKNIPNFKTLSKLDESTVINKFVDVMRSTGKAGVTITKKIGEFAISNPKSAIAGVMYGWFLADPEGFSQALKDFGGSVGEFASHLGGLMGDVVVGGTTGVATSLWDSSQEYMTFKNIMVLIFFLTLFIVWKFRTILISYIPKKEVSNNTSKTINTKTKTKKNKGRY